MPAGGWSSQGGGGRVPPPTWALRSSSSASFPHPPGRNRIPRDPGPGTLLPSSNWRSESAWTRSRTRRWQTCSPGPGRPGRRRPDPCRSDTPGVPRKGRSYLPVPARCSGSSPNGNENRLFPLRGAMAWSVQLPGIEASCCAVGQALDGIDGGGIMTKGIAGRRGGKAGEGRRQNGEVPGIVIADGMRGAGVQPRISAFIWGGKVRPAPTLPYGRWKDAI